MAVNIKQLKENGNGEVFYPQTTIEGLVNSNGNAGIDDVPVASHRNLVRSGGVATAIAAAKGEVKDDILDLTEIDFVIGGIAGADGSETDNAERCRSGFIKVDGVFRIRCASNYRYNVFFYENDGTFHKFTWDNVTDGQLGGFNVSENKELEYTGKIRILLQRTATPIPQEEGVPTEDLDCGIVWNVTKSVAHVGRRNDLFADVVDLSVAGSSEIISQINVGEYALNTSNGNLYVKTTEAGGYDKILYPDGTRFKYGDYLFVKDSNGNIVLDTDTLTYLGTLEKYKLDHEFENGQSVGHYGSSGYVIYCKWNDSEFAVKPMKNRVYQVGAYSFSMDGTTLLCEDNVVNLSWVGVNGGGAAEGTVYHNSSNNIFRYLYNRANLNTLVVTMKSNTEYLYNGSSYYFDTTLKPIANDYGYPRMSPKLTYNMIEGSDIASLIPADKSTEMDEIHGLYDELCEKYAFITKHDALEYLEEGAVYPVYARDASYESGEGLTTEPYHTYVYEIKRTESNSGEGTTNPKLNVVIVTGNHGNEYMAPFSMYAFIKKTLLEKPYEADILANYNLYVIPCLNGYGMIHNKRYNGNGVNINRNFPSAEWGSTSDVDAEPWLPSGNYPGTAQGSEWETQLVMKLAQKVGAVAGFDHHNYGGTNKQFYSGVYKDAYRPVIYNCLKDCTAAFKKNYPYYFGHLDEKTGMIIANGGTSPNVIGNKHSGMSQWFDENTEFGAFFEVSYKINFIDGAYATFSTSNTEYSKEAVSVAEYTVRAQMTRLLSFLHGMHYKMNMPDVRTESLDDFVAGRYALIAKDALKTDVSGWQRGWISTTGEEGDTGTNGTKRVRSGYYRVAGGKRYVAEWDMNGNGLLIFPVYYDRDKVFLGRGDMSTGDATNARIDAIAPAAAHYIRFMAQKTDNSDFSTSPDEVLPAFLAYNATLSLWRGGLSDDLATIDESMSAETAARVLSDNSLTAQIKATNDRIDELTFTEVTDWVQGWIGANGTEGDTGTNGPLRIRSGFYQVKAGDTLVVKFAEVEGADIYQVMSVWYDTQKVFVARESIDYSYEGVVPAGVGYVKFVLKRKSNTALSPVTYDGKMLTSATLDEDTPVVVETDPQVTLETGIPLYWREEIEEKSNVQKTIEANLGEQAQSFVFITDMHMDSNAKNSAALVGGILRRTNVNKVVFGGDVHAAQAVPSFKKVKPTDADELASDNQVVRNNMKQEFRDFQQLMKKVAANGGEYYPVHGNHDILQRAQYTDTTGSWQTLPWDEVSHIMMDILPAGSVRQSVNDNGSMYYYVDDYLNKTRMVVLDSFNNGTDISQSSQPSSAEITWLQQVIADVPQGWAVNIMNHAGIDAITNKGYGATSGLATAIYNAVSGSVLEDKVTIVNGHHHHDAVTHKGGTWQVAVMSDAKFGDAVKRSPVHQLLGVEYANSTTRGEHNTTEHAFDIFNTDYTNGLISIVRVGSGNGGCRYIHIEPIEASAGSTLALTKSKIGAVTAWGCYDNEGNVEANSGDTLWTFSNAVGTVSNGTFSALSAGESIVICADAEGNTEYWCVRVIAGDN